MPSVILNTCGTSLLTGGDIANELRDLLRRYANTKTWSDMPEETAEKLRFHAEQRHQELLAGDENAVCKLSAELNGLLSWQAQQPLHKEDMYYLLATDTALGKQAAESVQAWLQQKGYVCDILTSSGLCTSTLREFRESLSGLVKTIIEIINGYKARNYHVYFNLTGGFKAFNAFLQALSTIYADNTFYLFEGSKELLFIPKLPFRLDVDKVISDNLCLFSRLASDDLSVDRQACRDIPDSLLFYIDDQVVLSEWGQFLWESNYKEIYQQEKLLTTISKRITFGEQFQSSIKKLKLPPDMWRIINESIVSLAAYAESHCEKHLESLDPRPLQGKEYKEKKLWECNLDAHYRIFMVKEDNCCFNLEKVAKALH